MELVSVIIPTYNRASFLTRAVDSVVAQTWPQIEVIIVDDGSSDETPELVHSRYGSDSRVRYIRQNNRGVSAARNSGLSAASGEFIAFLDSDDEWEPWKLELQMEAFRRFPEAVLCWTDMSAIDNDGIVVHPAFVRRMYSAYSRYSMAELFDTALDLRNISAAVADCYPGQGAYRGRLFSKMITGNLVHTSSAVMRAACLPRVGSFRESWTSGEDYHFHLRVCREGPAVFLDVPSIRYRIGGSDQLSGHAYQVQMAINFLLTIREVIDKDKDRLSLSRKTRKDTFAHAHRWVAEEMLLAGDVQGGIEHLRHSLVYRKDLRVIVTLAVAFLPKPLQFTLRTSYRAVAHACLSLLASSTTTQN